MPKGRGSNHRRRTARQRHPKDKRESTARGHLKLIELGIRAVLVQDRRHKTAGTAHSNVAAAYKASDKRRKARR